MGSGTPERDTGAMTDDPRVPDEHDESEEDDAPANEEETPARRSPSRGAFPALGAFSVIQRQLAAIDFSALTAAQRAVEQATAFRIPEIVAAQEVVAKHFAHSIDFSHLAAAHKALVVDAGAITNTVAAQEQWADSLAKSVDFSALNNALASSAALTAFTETSNALTESLQRQTDVFARITEGISFKLPTIDVARWLEAFDRWIPINLRGLTNLDEVAEVSLDEGLPLSWVPRPEIVVVLVDADSKEERHAILDQRRDDILDDCDAALSSVENECARQCRAAIATLRAGFDAPAQSHASNIIDSIVLAFYGKNGRDHAKERAQEDFDDLPLQLAAENLTLRPLFRAFTSWWPTSGVVPPDHFARHATSHAVGHVGVFAPRSALVAVMLATSLTIQYSPGEPTPRRHDTKRLTSVVD